MATSHRRIRPTRRPDPPDARGRPPLWEVPPAGAEPDFDEVESYEATRASPESQPATQTKARRARRSPKAKLALTLSAAALALACWVFRAEIYKLAAISGNGLVLCALLTLPLVLAYFAFLLVRLLVRKGRKALAGFFLCFALLFCGWLSANAAAALVCDAEINAALSQLPPVGSGAIYVRRGEGRVPVYVPLDRSLSVAEVTASHSNRAVPAVEDERLRSRWEGVFDVRAVLRAAWNIVFFRRREGASTILVQAAKWVRIRNREQSFSSSAKDKLSQWFLALRLSQRFPSPEEQLTLYLNLVEVDGPHGYAYAASDFFAAPADKLSVEQSALLAGLLNNPTEYNPRTRPKAATERRNTVLKKMADNGLLADAPARQAAPLGLADPSGSADFAFYARAARGGERR